MLKKVFILIKVVVIVHLIVCIANEWWTATFICLFNLILLFVSDLVQTKIKYNDSFLFLIYTFLTASLLGGEVYYLYIKVWYLDIIMHILSSFIVSGISYYYIKYINIKINHLLFVTLIFSFAVMIASLWEITEFSIDRIFGKDMQKDTLIAEINSSLLSDNGKKVVEKRIDSMSIGDITLNGYIDIGLYDTIEDMICAVGGSLLFIIIIKQKEAF